MIFISISYISLRHCCLEAHSFCFVETVDLLYFQLQFSKPNFIKKLYNIYRLIMIIISISYIYHYIIVPWKRIRFAL